MNANDHSNSGYCFWVAFLKDGALRENSPNYLGLHCD